MTKLLLIVAAAFVLQIVLSMAQMKHFSKEFVKLRRQGKVACGRKAGGLRAGAIVMFLLDEDGIVRCAKKMEGVTCLARVRPLPGFEGRDIFRKFTAGEIIPEPPSPFRKLGQSVGVVRKTIS